MTNLTTDQLEQLKQLGINISKLDVNISNEIKTEHELVPRTGKINSNPIVSTRILPLLSISGLTLISFGGLVLFKNKTSVTQPPILESSNSNQVSSPSPTQVPKSIQHYLLTSQQYFTQALSFQQNQQNDQMLSALNQSVSFANEAISIFPQDYRGYEQRGRIYQSLIDSQPQLLENALADFTKASSINSNSPEITRSLATLFARRGDVQNTIVYLSKTVSLEPTKAQNFYDLARIQQQVGQLPQALETYNRLITIISDPSQKSVILAEKSTIEKLLSQNNNNKLPTTDNQIPMTTIQISPTVPVSTGPLLQANSGSGLIIAAPEISKNISVSSLVDSNSLSGTSILTSGQKSIAIANDNLSPSSQVYLTVIKGGKNLSLQVLSKSKNTFVVGLDTPTNEDISFKWWIINP